MPVQNDTTQSPSPATGTPVPQLVQAAPPPVAAPETTSQLSRLAAFLWTPFRVAGRMLSSAARALYNATYYTGLFVIGLPILVVRAPFRALAWAGRKVSSLLGYGSEAPAAATTQQPATEPTPAAAQAPAETPSVIRRVVSAVVNAPYNFVNMVVSAPGNLMSDVRSFFSGGVAAAPTGETVVPAAVVPPPPAAPPVTEATLDADVARTNAAAAQTTADAAKLIAQQQQPKPRRSMFSRFYLAVGWSSANDPAPAATATQGGTGPQAAVPPAPQLLAAGRRNRGPSF